MTTATATATVTATSGTDTLQRRMQDIDWPRIGTELDAQGWSVLPQLVDVGGCTRLAEGYRNDRDFRSRVVMQRHGFGRGEYRYYAYPLPAAIAELRTALYPPLAEVANRWHAALGMQARFPTEHAAFLARCHAAGQQRPTPLLLQYGAATTTACTRTCTANRCFRCRLRCCCRARARTSAAASSC